MSMMNRMVIWYKFAFMLLLLSSCVEDSEICNISNVNHMIPDGKERMELRLRVPEGKRPITRGIENGLAAENKIDRLFMDVMNSGSVIASRSTADGTLTLTAADVDSVYTAFALFDIGTLEAGYTLRLRVNEDTPAVISGQPVAPFYMSGTGVIENDGISRNFTASVHLQRGVAKLRTTVRKTSFTVPQNLIIGDVKVQVLHVADKIRKYAPFSSHANEAISENLTSLKYVDYPIVSLEDITLREQVTLKGEAATFYSQYIYENYLEQESDYNINSNVTSLKLVIPVTDGVTSRVIERTIPVEAEDSYRAKRNHIYSVDVQVLSLDEVKIFTDALDWDDVDVTGDIVGTDFYIDKTEVTLIKDIADPVKLVKVNCLTPGHLEIRVLKPNKTDLMPISDLQLYCNGIAESGKLANNSGVYDLTAAQAMNFYCTTGSVPANYEGGFIEIAADNVRKQLIPISALDRFTPLDTEGTSNSYIADKGAGSYSFTATVMGNGAVGIIDEGKFEDAMGNILTKAAGADIHPHPLSAKLLWQDTDELVEQVALVGGRVQVKMGRSRGNALIAVYDKADPNMEDAKVLWSWHLWCTDNPQIIEFTVPKIGNKYKMMDRNLGATTTEPGLGTTQGLHYQWGRKDPFSGSLTYDGKATILYNVRSVVSRKVTHEEPLTLAQAINNPDIFISRTWIDDVWCTKTSEMEVAEMRYVWGNPEGTTTNYPSLTVKTIYDPCPAGYKISPLDAFFIFNMSGLNKNGIVSYVDDKIIFLPITYNPGWAITAGTSGMCWSSSVWAGPNDDIFGQKHGASLYFYPGGNELTTTLWIGFVQPGSIRCVKE